MATPASVGNDVVNALGPDVVNPLIVIEEPKFVVVRKIYRNSDNTEHKNPDGTRLLSPKRRKVTLKTDKAFDKRGTFTAPANGAVNASPPSPRIRFFTKAGHTENGDKEIEFKNGDNVFTAEQLTAGHAIYAEGASVSAALDDVELKLELEQGGKVTGPAATAKMTSVELTIDICKDRPEAYRAKVSAARYAAAQAAGPAKLAGDATKACRVSRAFAAAAKANAAAADANVKAAEARAKAADSAAKAEDAKAKAKLLEDARKASPPDPANIAAAEAASQTAAQAAQNAAAAAETAAAAAETAATAADTAATAAETAAKEPDCEPGGDAAAKAAASAKAAAENARSAAVYARNPTPQNKADAEAKNAAAQTKATESRTAADAAATAAGAVANPSADAAKDAAAANTAATAPVNAATATNAAATATNSANAAAAAGAPPAIVTAANSAAANATAAAANANAPSANAACEASNATVNATAAANTPSYAAGTNTAEANDKMKAAAEANKRAATAAAAPDVAAAQTAAGEAETAANAACAAAQASVNAANGPSTAATNTANTVSAEDRAAATSKTAKDAADKEAKDAAADKAAKDQRVQDGQQNIAKLTADRDAAVNEQKQAAANLQAATQEQAEADRKNQEAKQELDLAQVAVQQAQVQIDQATEGLAKARLARIEAEAKAGQATGDQVAQAVADARLARAEVEEWERRLEEAKRARQDAQSDLAAAQQKADAAQQAKAAADKKKQEAEEAKKKADQKVQDAEKALQDAQNAQTQAVADQTQANQRLNTATTDQTAKTTDYNNKAAAAAAVAPVVIPAPDKVVKGRYVQQQVSPINSAARAQIIIRKAKPEQFVCTLVLKPIDARVKAFENEFLAQGENVVKNPYEVENAKVPEEGVRFWAQGESLSVDRRDTGFRLGLKAGGYEENDGDLVKATVFSLEFVLAQDPAAAVPRAAQAGDPTSTFVRFGLWDKAYAANNVKNAVADADHFAGSDTRRFFLRLRGPRADDTWPAQTAQIEWRTRKDDWSNDDVPGTQTLTLIETAAGSRIFISKAVLIVPTDVDRDQATDSGLTVAQGPTGSRAAGQSEHRLRRAAIDGFVEAAYPPPAVADGASTAVTVFNRDPEERKRIQPAVIRYTGVFAHPTATNAYIAGQFSRAADLWAQVGLRVVAGAIVDRAVPPAALNGANLYAGSANNAFENAALADLIAVTTDDAITVIFVPLTGSNAYSTIAPRAAAGFNNRFFIFMNTNLDLEDLTLGHELHHVLFNRYDEAVRPRFYTFNTTPPNQHVPAVAAALPDVRVERRLHNHHNADPDHDAVNGNVINWMRRVRTGRHPVAGAYTPAPDANTGNTMTQPY